MYMSSRKLTVLAILTSLTASSFYLYEFLARVFPAAITTQITQQFHLSPISLSMLASAFFLGYAPMQIPSGLLIDRFGEIKCLLIGFFICALSSALFVSTDHYSLAYISRLLIGISASVAFIGAIKVINRLIPSAYFAMSVGLLQCLGCLGAIIGESPIASLSLHYGWQRTGYMISIFGIILTCLLLLSTTKYQRHKPAHSKAFGKKTLAKLFSQSQLWWITLFNLFIWAPISIFAAFWGIPFLKVLTHTTTFHAANLVAFIWIGTAIGGPILGYMSYKLQSRKKPMIIASLLGIVSASCIIYFHFQSDSILIIALFLFGVGSSAQGISFALLSDTQATHHLATTSGVVNMGTVMGGVLLQPLVGMMLSSIIGNNFAHLPNNILTHGYQVSLSVVPMCFFAAFTIISFCIKETHPKAQHY